MLLIFFTSFEGRLDLVFVGFPVIVARELRSSDSTRFMTSSQGLGVAVDWVFDYPM